MATESPVNRGRHWVARTKEYKTPSVKNPVVSFPLWHPSPLLDAHHTYLKLQPRRGTGFHHGDQRTSASPGNWCVACFDIGESGCPSTGVLRFAELICGPTARPLGVSSAFGKQLKISHSHQSQLVQCLFGITSLRLEWRSIWFGNRSGIS